MLQIEAPQKSDFHCHTICSDGTLTPEELVDYAVCERKKIKVLAITDHDNMNAVAPAMNYVAAKGFDLKIIPGIEFSTSWSFKSCDFSIHIVGLFCDEHNKNLLDLVALHKKLRDERVELISEKLLENSSLDPQKLSDMLTKLRGRNTFVTRKHFSNLLIENEIVSCNEEAFDKYLSRSGKAYVKIVFSSIPDVINAIHQAGGLAILAHPLRYKNMHHNVLRFLAQKFADWGGDGIECAHPNQNMGDKLFIRDLAIKYNFLASMGSDFHELNVPYRSLGSGLWLTDKVKPIWTDSHFDGYY